jgi:Uma2 family endonuclease
MAEVGILAQDARVELIQGEILDTAPIGTRHSALVDQLNLRLVQGAAERAIVSVQRSIRLDQHSQPQPDIALLEPRSDFYKAKFPTAADVLLLVEVSDTSSRYDREIKIPLYARHGITELWLIDVQARELTCLREPSLGRYSNVAVLTTGTLRVAALPDVILDLDWLWR